MLSFQILGPLEVVRDGRPLQLGAAKQRALVAILLLNEGEVVSTGRLIDGLWGEEPPATVDHLLHVYISRLRKLLEADEHELLLTRPPGYVLRLREGDELDAEVFETSVRQARSSGAPPAERLAQLAQALGLWRGAVLADLADESFVVAAAARLDELRAVAQEERIEALLASGRHEEAVPELEDLVARYPLRERLRAQQMLALYRSGRQGDALAAFGATRRLLAEELGVDPGPALRSLEEDILRHAPELEAPSSSVMVPVEPGVPPIAGPGVTAGPPRVEQEAAPGPVVEDRPLRRRRVRASIVGLAVAAIAGVAVIVVPRLGGPDAATPPPTSAGHEGQLLDWREVPSKEVFVGSGDQIVLGGADTSFGYLALGHTASVRAEDASTRDYDAAVWTASSPEGWVRPLQSDVFVGPGNQQASDAAVLGDLLVIVGRDDSLGDFDPAVWFSSDGSSWSRVPPELPALRQPGSDEAMRDVTLVGDRLVAVGYVTTEADSDAAVWRSPDGSTWVRSVGLGGPPGDEQMAAVVSFGGGALAAGYSTSDDRDAAVWRSDDGEFWKPVESEAFGGVGDQQINAIASGCPGLIAVGKETIDGETNAAVWTSPDGARWERVQDRAGVFGGQGAQQMFTIACSPVGIVAAGSEVIGPGSDGAVWTAVGADAWVREPGDAPEMSALADPAGRQKVTVLLPLPDGFLALGGEGRGPDDDADAWIGRLET